MCSYAFEVYCSYCVCMRVCVSVCVRARVCVSVSFFSLLCTGLQCGTVSRVARCTAQTLPCRALGSVAGCLRKTSTKFVPSCQHAVRRKHYDSGSMPAPFLDDQDDELRALRNIVRSHNPKTLTEDIKKDVSVI